MHLAVYLSLISSGLFGLTAPRVAARLPPALGTWLLSGGALLAAVGSTAACALLGFTLVGQNPRLASLGGWSLTVLRHADPVSTPIAAAALAALVLLGITTSAAACSQITALRSASRLAADLSPPGGELTVIQDPDPVAFALAGRPGRIVVSASLLRSLDAGERRALLAHERAHLTHRHHLHQAVARVSAAANPLLRRTPAAVALACERWADEEAARVCRREVVATALRHTALGQTRSIPPIALSAAVLDVAYRVQALQMPTPRLAVWRVALPLILLAVTVLAVGYAAHDTEHLFELAQSAYRTGNG